MKKKKSIYLIILIILLCCYVFYKLNKETFKLNLFSKILNGAVNFQVKLTDKIAKSTEKNINNLVNKVDNIQKNMDKRQKKIKNIKDKVVKSAYAYHNYHKIKDNIINAPNNIKEFNNKTTSKFNKINEKLLTDENKLKMKSQMLKKQMNQGLKIFNDTRVKMTCKLLNKTCKGAVTGHCWDSNKQLKC